MGTLIDIDGQVLNGPQAQAKLDRLLTQFKARKMEDYERAAKAMIAHLEMCKKYGLPREFLQPLEEIVLIFTELYFAKREGLLRS